jgi:hypothetical protein
VGRKSGLEFPFWGQRGLVIWSWVREEHLMVGSRTLLLTSVSTVTVVGFSESSF